MSEQDKLALVTGASRGIGRAIADQLAVDGFTVLGTATTQEGADKLTAHFADKGLNGQGLVLNVADAESVDALFAKIKTDFVAPLVVVNNAGITKDNLLMRMKVAEWDDVINTNLSSVYRLSKAALRGMTKARWGRIINVSSVVGSMGNMGQSNYAAAKAGLEGFTRALAKEVGSRSITVNAIAPGFIATDMTEELSAEQTELMLSQIPLNRLGEGREIAHAVSFLASDGAAYITGETLHVNGGMYMA